MRKIFCFLALFLLLPVAALGETITLIDDETTARQFALCFFSNPFVEENVSDSELTVRSIDDEYLIDVQPNDQHGALMLRFDDAGVIRQYWNQAWHFPKLTAWDPGWTGVDPEEENALCTGTETFSRLLLSGRFYDLVALMRSEENEEQGIFTLLLNRDEAYLALRAEPLKVAPLLSPDAETTLSTEQPFFNYMGSTAADGSPIPVWEVLVHVEYADRSDTYYVILNAQTGEILQTELQEPQDNG